MKRFAHSLLALFFSFGVVLLMAAIPAQAATFEVDTTSDANLTTCSAAPADCSLRGAINRANSNAVPDTIAFSIPGSGFKTITPSAPLPTLSDSRTFVDGNSQPGYNGLPLIVLSGAQISTATLADGISIATSGCRVRGLTLHGWEKAIKISGAQAVGNQMEGCFIGTDIFGRAVPSSTNNTGVAIDEGADDNIVGGATAAQRNIISANRSQGVLVTGLATVRNRILGNYIGPNRYGNAFGDVTQRNGVGVALFNRSYNNYVGDSGAGNLISGNRGGGIYVFNSHGHHITGNRIGTDAGGRAAVGNGPFSAGIRVRDSSATFIGGVDLGDRNVISGNTSNGITVDNSFNISIDANYIGVDATGTKALGNANGIVMINGAGDNMVGTSRGNVISGNDTGVVLANQVFSNGERVPGRHVIAGNYIGTNALGTGAIPNVRGIMVQYSTDNTIGGATRGARNLISGNTTINIHLQSTDRNLIQGNFIGTNSGGGAALGRFTTYAGIYLQGVVRANQIGGATPGARNIISGQVGHGIFLEGVEANAIENNYIGVDATGTNAVPNGKDGIALIASSSNSIGGALRNVISGNNQHGISISGFMGVISRENSIAGNYIGLNARGDAVIGNGSDGVLLDGAVDCRIGDRAAGLNNLISGNGGAGILIRGSSVGRHFVFNNYIGLDATGGKAGFGNKGPGVFIDNSAAQNYIGVAGPFGRNVISGNGNNIMLSNASGNRIRNNFIGPKADGRSPLYDSLDNTPPLDGIIVANSDFNAIGGTAPGERNIISGNGGFGLNLQGKGNAVFGNFIGTDATGTQAVANGFGGVFIRGRDHVIGGAIPATRNIISGNGKQPTSVEEGNSPAAGSGVYLEDAINVKIEGNFIGLDARGTNALPNQAHGVYTTNSSVTIGGATTRPGTTKGNVISGNHLSGVQSDTSRVIGNLIGTDFSGTKSVPNQSGITIRGTATHVGSANPQGRNIISGNRGAGVLFSVSGADRNYSAVAGNYIGTDISGQKAIPNYYGVHSQGGGSIGNITERPGRGNGNVISGNYRAGVYVEGGATLFGNAIGVAADGITPLPNRTSDLNAADGAGILVQGRATIGGPPVLGRTGNYQNIIAYNEGAGVRVLNGASAEIRANSVFSNGALGIDQGEAGVTPGVVIESPTDPRFVIPPFPILQSATQSAPNAPLIIQGSVQTARSQNPIDVFASDEPDPSGFGEGQIYLGSFSVGTRPDNPFVTFNQVLEVNTDLTGKWITTTIGNFPTYANTSEFSKAIPVARGQGSTESSHSSVKGAAYASSASVAIIFDTRLQSVIMENVTAKVNGQNVPIQGVEVNGQVMTVLLPQDSFTLGDEVEIFWRDLQASDGRKLTGNTPPLVAQ